MTKTFLYTYGGVSLSPTNKEDRRISKYVRLTADTDKGITNGNIITTCIDVLNTETNLWSDCDIPEQTEYDELEDMKQALKVLGVE